MALFGQNLRQAREARNITLEEVASTTKVSSRALHALEDERFDLLPGGIFNKGFVRAYARCVGLDEEKTVAAYLEAAKLATPEIDMQELSTQVSAARQGTPDRGPSAATVVGVLALIVALAVGAVWLRELRKDSREHAAAQQAGSSGTNPAAPASATPSPAVGSEQSQAPAATGNTTDGGAALIAAQNAPQNVPPNSSQSVGQGAASDAASNAAFNASQNTRNANQSASPAHPVAASGGAAAVGSEKSSSERASAPVEISISATARAWISVRSDGKTVETLTLDPEKPEMSTRSYKANEKLTLVVGNPAGLAVTYNGKPAGTLGVVGHPVTITFTPQGMEKQ